MSHGRSQLGREVGDPACLPASLLACLHGQGPREPGVGLPFLCLRLWAQAGIEFRVFVNGWSFCVFLCVHVAQW